MTLRVGHTKSPADGSVEYKYERIPEWHSEVSPDQHVHMNYMSRWARLGAILLVFILSCGENSPFDPIEDDGHFGWRVGVHATLSNTEGDSTLTKYRLILDEDRDDLDNDRPFDPPRSSTNVYGRWDPSDGPGEHTLSVTILGQISSPSTYTISDISVYLNELKDFSDWWDGGERVTEITVPGKTALLATGERMNFTFTL